MEHLEELRWHLVRSLTAVVLIAIIVFASKPVVLAIVFGPTRPNFITYEILCNVLKQFMDNPTCLRPTNITFITPNFGEKFITYLKLSIILGIVASFPYIFWEFWRFISPGLYDKERKAAKGVVFICSFLFILGVLFGYFVLSPFAVTFLTGFEIEDIKEATPSFSSYINYLTMFTVPLGLVFEMPVLVYFLSKIGLLTPEFMRTYRRHAIVVILILAAVITPPDVVTQFLVGIPLFILYEISIFVSKRVVDKAAKEEND
ncbi:MAG: twin-arginine translocase subunit TatC [Saprospiraceae bacterium]|nr:twin-arginine translocase subunit TatC [Saprospiraceae bacterium]